MREGEREREMLGGRKEGGGGVSGLVLKKRVSVFMCNLVYKIESTLYRFNLSVTAHPQLCAQFPSPSAPDPLRSHL